MQGKNNLIIYFMILAVVLNFYLVETMNKIHQFYYPEAEAAGLWV